MRLREVFRFELAYLLRSPSIWIYVAILFGFSFMLIHANTGSGDTVHVNAPKRLAEFALIVGMFGMLVTAAVFADAAVRDVDVGMDPLLFTSPLGKAEYLGGRFLAALSVNAGALLAIPLGLMAATLMPYQPPEEFGPFRVAAYVQPYLLFLLPNVVLVGATLFTIAIRARQTIPVYIGVIGLFIGYLIAASNAQYIDNRTLSALADPFGMVSVKNMSAYSTTVERNTELLGFPAMLVWNRVLWLAVAAALLALLHHRFRFAHAPAQGAPGGVTRNGSRNLIDASPERAQPVAVPRVAGSFGLRTRIWQTLSVARNALEEVVASPSFVVVLLGYMGFALLWGWDVGDSVFDTSTWPVTHLVAGMVKIAPPVIWVLIAIYAGELVWKDRDVGVAEIADAAPVPEGALLLGRFLALVAMLAALQVAFIVGSILTQSLQGYYHFEVGLYLRLLLGLSLADYVLLAALAMLIHVVVNQKYLGHIVVLMAFVFTVIAPELGILRHHLLIYGTDPGWTYSDMNGFGPFIGPFVWFKLYWAAWALLLAVVATLFWMRGREPGVRHRLGGARDRFAGLLARTAGAGTLLILGLGGFIFYNTNVLNAYLTPDERGAQQAAYEKRYERFESAPQPVITAADLRVDIYPEKPAADLRGTFRLVNQTGAAIDSVHLYMPPEVQARSISFDRASKPVLTDDEVGYRIYFLERALQPGDSLRLAFNVSYKPRGFPNSAIQTDVVSNGAYFHRTWMPIIGYQPAFELSGDEARQRFGLGPHPPIPGPEDAGARRFRQSLRDADLVHVKAVVGTAADQIAVTPGVLRRSWMENGRRYFHYETEKPTSFSGTFFSARYAVVEDRWNDPSPGSAKAVDLRIDHHPAHDYNLDRAVRSMKASLAYYTGQFGPYQDSQLRIVEFPPYGGFGIAHPHTIAFTEGYFLSRVREGEVDQPFYGTAHEIAHQWWGGQVKGAPVRGHGFLSESLANYSAMMVTEKTYGPEAARRVYDFQMERYLLGRASQSREVPLLEVEDQPYIAYRKGAIALYTMREHIGERRVNTALRRYLEKHRDGVPPYPTSLDLYAELRAATPDALRSLLVDLFEEVTLWDVRTERAHVERTGTGQYQVTLEVVARKLRADSIGKETEVPMDDLVEVGVFAPGGEASLGAPLHLQRHRIRSGKQTIQIVVGREPSRAGIDPYRKLIDRQREDNVVGVEGTGAVPVRGRPSRSTAFAPGSRRSQ